ncbi:Ubiquitin domain-containing protein 1 [Cladobotryum mycophilum]|uniref:Ubiquitin domain-containing protein 1 n=1 Tax=Cladobotryum mycophilum TaxID=491253 RepID=A0ABR0SY08_9HYPO
MGCCFSRPTGPNSPYPGGAPDASSRAINPLPATPTVEDTQPGRRRRRDQDPLGQHLNRPLRRHVWTSTRRQWTRRELVKERAEFFDTRVTGRPEIWQTLHAALRALWEPVSGDSQDESSGLATAQSIIDAAEISLPTGDLVNGAYDPLGNLYPLPEWIVADPDNIINDEDGKRDLSLAGEDTAGEDDDDADLEDAERRREEKGKGILEERETITLRARLSDTGKDILITIHKSDKVKSIVKKIAEKASASNKNIRIAYMGKMLRENASLETQGWQTGHVVNAMIFGR